MNSVKVNCGKIEISNDNKICIIAGPCQLETEQHAMDMGGKIHDITKKYINRTQLTKGIDIDMKLTTILKINLKKKD